MKFSGLVKSLFLLIILASSSCRTLYQNITFNEKSVPLKPDYSESKSWAVLPGKYPRVLKKFEKIKNLRLNRNVKKGHQLRKKDFE